MGILAERLSAAGYNTTASRVAMIAIDLLRKHERFPEKAIDEFVSALTGRRDLLREALLPYLRERAADMRGQELGAGGHSMFANGHDLNAAGAQPIAGSDGQSGTAEKAGSPLPPDLAVQSGAGGHIVVVERPNGRCPPAPDVNEGAQGHHSDAHIPAKSLLPRALSPSQLHAARAIRQAAAITVLDTFKIDGRAIGDYTVSEALRIGKDKTRDAHVLLVLARKVANANPWAKLRDVVKISEVQSAIQSAAEAADVA